MKQQFEDVIDDLTSLDDWEDRYRYIIDLGKALPLLDEKFKTAEFKVSGCVSQVWLVMERATLPNGAVTLSIQGDSDALIVKGLVAITLKFFEGRSLEQIVNADALQSFAKLGLKEHLTPQRSNGLASMVNRIQETARHYLQN